MKKISLLVIILAISSILSANQPDNTISNTILIAQQTDDTEIVGFSQAIREISDYIYDRVPRGNKVLFLNIQSSSASQSEYIIEELTSIAVNEKSLGVVNRNEIAQILQEQSFQISGNVADDEAVRIGQLSSAQTIITGSFRSAGSNIYRLSIRVLDVQTARVLGIVNKNVEINQTTAALMGMGGAVATRPPTTTTPPTVTRPVVSTPPNTTIQRPISPATSSNKDSSSSGLLLLAGYGVNLVTFDYAPDYSEISSKNGFHIGAAASFDLGSIILEPGLRYVTRGYGETYKIPSIGFKVDYQFTVNYLDSFIKAKLDAPIGSMSILPYLGVAPSFKIGEQFEMDGKSIDLEGSTTFYESFNLFILAGVDFLIADTFLVGLEYDYGALNILSADAGADASGEKNSAYMMSFFLNIGYKLNF